MSFFFVLTTEEESEPVIFQMAIQARLSRVESFLCNQKDISE